MAEKFYANCRGTNWFPEYPSIWEQYGGLPSPENLWFGNAGPYTTWKFYHSGDSEDQVAKYKSIGMNCLRVWLSYLMWETDSETFCANIQDFARILDKYQMRAIWTLFDGIGVGPSATQGFLASSLFDVNGGELDSATSAITSIYTMHPPAGNAAVIQTLNFDANVDAYMAGGGFDYIEAVVSSVSGSQSTLLYDVFNEPKKPEDLSSVPIQYFDSCNYFLEECLAKVKELDPGGDGVRKTTIGFASVAPVSAIPGKWYTPVSSTNLDVVSFHQYIMLSSVREHHVSANEQVAEDYGKPIICTESLNPDYFITYEDITDYWQSKGMGYCLFDCIREHPFSSGAFNLFGLNLFYADGDAVDRINVSAMIRKAEQSGHYGEGQLPDYIAISEKGDVADVSSIGGLGGDFERRDDLVQALSSTLSSRYPWWNQSINNATKAYGQDYTLGLSDVGYTNFCKLAGHPSGVFPYLTPSGHFFCVANGTKLGQFGHVVSGLNRSDIVASCLDWDNRLPLSGFLPADDWPGLQRQLYLYRNMFIILIRDLGVVSDHANGYRGTIYERNILAESNDEPNALLLEAQLSSVGEVLGSNLILEVGLPVSSQASAINYDVSMTVAMEPIVSALGILGETV